jgi:hypothetical protein
MLLVVQNVLSPEKKNNRPALWGRTSSKWKDMDD